jgi:glycine/D-amino acid oxidase-like deaminating enzyme
MTHVDYDTIIVGQGLAGTSLAWSLRWRGQRLLVIDREDAVTSSRVAAGLMTPITGQRLVKSWRWDRFWSTATEFYRRIEAETRVRFFFPGQIVRLLVSADEQAFLARKLTAEFSDLVNQPCPLVDDANFDAGLGGFQMLQGGRLNVVQYLDTSRRAFLADNQFVTQNLDLNCDIELTETGVHLPRLGLTTKRLIFCQGIDAQANPWFQNVRFKPAKGEILTVRIEGLAEERIVSRGVWLMPIGNNLFRAGATYEWKELNCEPTSKGRDEICERLAEFLRLPFEVVGHEAAVRPILKHQYPVIGLHPRHRQLGYVNGLGSKGSLQAPWLAQHFAGYLAGKHFLDPDVTLHQYERPIVRVLASTDDASQSPRSGKRSATIPLTESAHTIIRTVLRPGDIAIDATAGNGYDTQFLAECVGPSGKVFSFDIQATALAATSERLKAAGLNNVTLLHRSHAELHSALVELAAGSVSAVMLNLGYLPGGDKSLTTQIESTTAAIRGGLSMLAPGGMMTIVAYPGHPGGSEEAAAVEELLNGLDRAEFEIREPFAETQNTGGPRLFVVRPRQRR